MSESFCVLITLDLFSKKINLLYFFPISFLKLQDMSVRIARQMRLMLTHQVRCVFTPCNMESMLSCYLNKFMLDNNCCFLLLLFLDYQTAKDIC